MEENKVHKLVVDINNFVCAEVERRLQELLPIDTQKAILALADERVKVARLREALSGVIRVADRKTIEFEAARYVMEQTK